ncbi:MAG: hypothetical protein HY584_01830 [Candidatus Omnitrophica bacterium]|nr:hypothetical protein [Candidatus Omnitrophota bacterium]
MKRSSHSFFVIAWAAFFFAAALSQTLEAQPARNRDGILERLDRLVKELEVIENKLEAIKVDQAEIVEQIKNLKIWVRR